MNTKLNKGGVFAAVALAATLQACSSGDSFVQNLDPGTSGATLSGSAVKGILANADCIATTVSGVVLYSSVGETEPCTSSSGAYTIPLLFSPSEPVIVEIRARSNTTMKCDLPAGCAGGVAFGGDVSVANLGDSFSMRALVPEVAAGATSLTTNVTPWTEAAVERAITVASDLSAVTSTTVNDAYEEVASILNNVLSLEGSEDAFSGDFFSVPLPDLTSPADVEVDSSLSTAAAATKKRQAALLSIASSSLLNLASDSKTVDAVLDDLSNSLKSDGEIDVNASASNIAGDAINLASVVRNIATTVSGLESSLSSNTTGISALNTLLGSTSITEGLSEIQTAAETLADAKDAVTDATLDTTKPIKPVSTALSALDKAKSTVAKLINILNASSDGLDADDDNAALDPVFVDVGDVLSAGSDSYMDGLDYMAYLMEGAASMIADKAFGDVDAFTGAGCTISGDDISCTTAQLGNVLDDPSNELKSSTQGTIAYTHSSRTVTATGVVVGGHTLALTMVGNSSTTAPSYTVTSATINLSDDAGDVDVSFGTTTVGGVIADDNGQSFTINAKNVTISLEDFTLVANLATTRDLTIRDTLITNFNLNGYVQIASDTDSSEVVAANRGGRVTFTIAFKGNSGSLASDSPSALPMPTEETADNFLAATGIVLSIGYPAQVNVFDATTGVQSSTATNVVFSTTLRGVRDSWKNGNVTALTMKVIGSGLNSSLTGDLTVSTSEDGLTQTTTWTLGDANNVITLVFVETAASRTFSGTVATKAGVSMGTINGSGTIALSDSATGESASLSIPTTLVSELLVR